MAPALADGPCHRKWSGGGPMGSFGHRKCSGGGWAGSFGRRKWSGGGPMGSFGPWTGLVVHLALGFIRGGVVGVVARLVKSMPPGGGSGGVLGPGGGVSGTSSVAVGGHGVSGVVCGVSGGLVGMAGGCTVGGRLGGYLSLGGACWAGAAVSVVGALLGSSPAWTSRTAVLGGLELLALVLGPKEVWWVPVVVGGNESGGRMGMSAKTAGWRLGGGATVGARAGGGV